MTPGRWRAVSIAVEGGQAAPLPGTALTLELAADGGIAGFAGCNRYFGRLDADGAPGPLGSTMMACPPEIMGQERSFLDLLQQVDRFQESDGRLLAIGDGVVVAIFEPIAQDPRGATWRLVGMHDGAEAFSSVSGNAVVSAHFDEQGRLGGSSGCNRYSASCHIEGTGLVVGQPAATRMSCPDPEVMDIERRFLAWLPKVASFRIDVGRSGRVLDLVDGDGIRILAFVEESNAT